MKVEAWITVKLKIPDSKTNWDVWRFSDVKEAERFFDEVADLLDSAKTGCAQYGRK